jgi:hypothetical protein
MNLMSVLTPRSYIWNCVTFNFSNCCCRTGPAAQMFGAEYILKLASQHDRAMDVRAAILVVCTVLNTGSLQVRGLTVYISLARCDCSVHSVCSSMRQKGVTNGLLHAWSGRGTSYRP